jgi:hypothetical protein
MRFGKKKRKKGNFVVSRRERERDGAHHFQGFDYAALQEEKKKKKKKSVPPTDNAVPASNYDPLLLLRWSKEINVNHTHT